MRRRSKTEEHRRTLWSKKFGDAVAAITDPTIYIKLDWDTVMYLYDQGTEPEAAAIAYVEKVVNKK